MSQAQIPLELCNARNALAEKGCIALSLVVVILILFQVQGAQEKLKNWYNRVKDDEQPQQTKALSQNADYSDADSEPSKLGKRKYQRGGRKKKSLETLFTDGEAVGDSENEAEMASELLELPPKPATAPPEEPTGADFKTGIKAFNLKRADESSRRPFGISLDRGEDKGQESGTKKDDSSGEAKKPVSIRLDLNLELEVILRAKIKGDITITFLE